MDYHKNVLCRHINARGEIVPIAENHRICYNYAMQKLFILALLATALAGCIGSAPSRIADNWAIEFSRAGIETVKPKDSSLPSIKISSVNVRAPWDGTRLAVMRQDGSVAFDPFNTFASAPQIMLRGVAQDSLEGTGLFSLVLANTSNASADYSAEIIVTRLALDCREENQRLATCALTLSIIDGKKVVATGRGEASLPTENGDYSAAFSKVFCTALSQGARRAIEENPLAPKGR